MDANYFACQPTPLVPQVTVQGCVAPKVLLGLVWAVDFLLMFHFVGVLGLTIRTPRLNNFPHPLFIAIAQNPVLQPPTPSFSPVMPPSPSGKSIGSGQTRRKLMRKRASEQLTLNDGGIDQGFWGNDSGESDDSVGPSMREIAAEEALGVKNASGRRRASSLPGAQAYRRSATPPPVPPLPPGVRDSAASIPLRQRQISMPHPLGPHQVNMNLMPLPQAHSLPRPQHMQSHQWQPQPIHPQPYYSSASQPATPRERTYNIPYQVDTAPNRVSKNAMRSQTMPIPDLTTLKNFRDDYNVAPVPPMPTTPRTTFDVQQLYRFPTSAADVVEGALPALPQTPRTPAASFSGSSLSRFRSRRPSRATLSTSLPTEDPNPRQPIRISAPLTSMPTFPEQATHRMSQRPSHVPNRLTIPAPLAPQGASWPSKGASRVTVGLAYPEPATVVARRQTESRLNGALHPFEQPRKAYTRPSIILGIANPTPTPSPEPPTPSVYAPSPEPILTPQTRIEQSRQIVGRPRKESLKDLEAGNLRSTGAELYARYMAERYPSAA
ncbi:hypothetical protein CALVIDRAFT_561379 [Calocera viscosa TUFC12733]|uniref:Uncharacterized protein n=1 Tax=Calocera viscosa (strain TUFC12733) TaxID=1330018 RepID=A0A167Q8K7_CALVF|nr:hypothetical protein CALVIDRAFT_561379 [Calocera viscosa TUFC12733]